jgi:hypothetical protein
MMAPWPRVQVPVRFPVGAARFLIGWPCRVTEAAAGCLFANHGVFMWISDSPTLELLKQSLRAGGRKPNTEASSQSPIGTSTEKRRPRAANALARRVRDRIGKRCE